MLPKMQERIKHVKLDGNLYRAAMFFGLQLLYGNGKSKSDRA